MFFSGLTLLLVPSLFVVAILLPVDICILLYEHIALCHVRALMECKNSASTVRQGGDRCAIALTVDHRDLAYQNDETTSFEGIRNKGKRAACVHEVVSDATSGRRDHSSPPLPAKFSPSLIGTPRERILGVQPCFPGIAILPWRGRRWKVQDRNTNTSAMTSTTPKVVRFQTSLKPENAVAEECNDDND